jgi:hypothetical protein
MSDDLERRLKQFPSEFPRPDEEVTRRVAGQLRVRQRRTVPLTGALLAALAIGATLGSVATSASNSTVSIGVRPSIMRFGEKPEIFGAVTSSKADEEVTVQFRQCGLYPAQFRDFMTTRTIEGGAWSLVELLGVRLSIPASGTFRALWNGEVSREVRFQVRASVRLVPLPIRGGRRFHVLVAGAQSFWHRRVRIERFDTRRRNWRLVQTVLVTETLTNKDYGSSTILDGTKPFRIAVPRGTTVRAVLPLAETRPCYLAGYSTLQRT